MATLGVCGACEKEIRQGPFALHCEALGKIWHKTCFKCVTCSKILTGEFTEVDGKPMCNTCVPQQPQLRCAGCKKKINGQYLEAFDLQWHHDCLKCHRCQKIMHSGHGMLDSLPPLPIHIECLSKE